MTIFRLPTCLRAAVATFLALVFSITGSASSKSAPQGPLVKVAEYHLQHARQAAAIAALGDYVYIFGGYGGGALGYVERLNANTGQVETVASNALARRYHAAIEYDGRFYLFGGRGRTLDGGFEPIVEVFDPQSQTLSKGESMPRPGSNMAAARLNERVFFLGGNRKQRDQSVITNDVDAFNFAHRTWSISPPGPVPCEGAAVAVDSYILLLGGFDGEKALANVLAYSPDENTWRQLPPLSHPTSAHSVARLGSYVFLFGDYKNRNQVLAYDLATLKTIDCQPGFVGVRHSAATAHRGRIYVAGGNLTSTSGDESDLVQVFALNPEFAAR